MTTRFVGRLIAGTCILVAAPIILIVVSWLPAVVLSVSHYYRALNISGTPSFHRDMASHFKQSIITVCIFAGSVAAWVGYVFIVLEPRPRRDELIWLFGFAITGAYFANNTSSLRSMNRDGLLLFGAIPMLVGALSLLGLWVSRRALRPANDQT
jgi:hypothetical protein